MSGFSPNLYLAALGPLTELIGLVVVVAVFALLRAQADRRPYFQDWEKAFVFFAVALTAGLFYERFVDPTSVFYPAAPLTTRLAAVAYLTFRLASLAMFVTGAQIFTRGTSSSWLPKAAVVIGIALALIPDTTRTPLAPLGLLYGPVAAIAFGYATLRFAALPASRRSMGTLLTTTAFGSLAALAAALAAFYALQYLAPAITGNPWLVRFARYGFYLDLALSLLLAWAMMRLLIEDGRREADDTRARLRLMQNRDKLGDLYDSRTRLLGRRAFDAFVGLDFARASFGSVALLRITNFQRVATEHGPAVAEALVVNIAGVLDSAVRDHDRVYRWGTSELLIVMPRAVAAVTRARVEFLVGRVAPLTISGVGDALRAETGVSVQFYTGGEDLAAAAATVSRP